MTNSEVTAINAQEGPYTVPQFAALCRERCARTANGYEEADGVRCGDEHEHDGETVYAFCGFHMLAVMGGE